MKRLFQITLLTGIVASSLQASPVTWEAVFGGGTDLGIGEDGTVWLLGENGWLEDKPIFRRDGAQWTPIWGGGMSISVDPNGQAWVANKGGEIYRYDGSNWQLLPGQALDISVGADGTVWIIGYIAWPVSWDVPPENVAPFRWNPTASVWDKVDGAGVRIAVDPTGRPWMINREGEIFRRKANNTTSGADQWELMPGSGTDIGIGADGTVWLVGGGKWIDNHDLFIWNGSDWSLVDGSGMRIAAKPDGSPWMINVDGDIFRGHLFSLTAGDVPVVEGDTATFAVGLSEAHTDEVRVDYATVAGTATETTDYVPTSGLLVFAPGVTNQTVSVSVNSDALIEGPETFGLKLANSVNAFIRTAQATATISDMPTLTIADGSGTEGGNLAFIIQRVGATNSVVSVVVGTASGTATSGLDFVGATNVVTFEAGETNKVFAVVALTDGIAEAMETFLVNLTEPVGASLSRAQATGSIADDGTVLNPSDLLRFDAATGTLIVKTVPGERYTVEYTETLGSAPVWKPFQAFVGTGSPVVVFVVETPGQARFYRVRVGGA